MSNFNIIVLIAVLISIGAICLVIYVLRKRQEYTREKFAFTALVAFVAFAGTIVTSIVGKESPWTTVGNLIRALLGLPKEPSEPRTADHILLVLVLGIVAIFIYRIYRDWRGVISADEHQRDRLRTRPTLLRDGLDEARHLVQRKSREIYRPTASPPSFSPLDIPRDTLEWHLQAIELIQLRNPSYRFSSDAAYHPEAHCWLGEHPQVRKTVAVLCVPQQPTAGEIGTFLDYVQRVTGRALAPDELTAIIAVRNSETRDGIYSGFPVETYGEQALLDDLVNFRDYFDYLERRVKRDTLADSEKTLELVYAPSACVVEGTKEVLENVETVLEGWLQESGQRQLALLGEYGQGKSTTALMFAYHLVAKFDGRPPRVPILIELRGRSPRNTTPEGLVAEWAYRFSQIVPKAVMKLIVAGRALVILEGFDEMALAGDAQARYAHFRTLWGFSYPKSKVLFTGRPNYFLDDRELKSALNIERSAAAGAYCESLRLEPFNIEQMRLALRSYPSQTRDNIIALANSNPKFREVASRGSLLYVIGELWGRPGGLGQHGGDVNSALVIGTFIRSTYERQASKWREIMNGSDANKKLADFMVLNTSEREFFMTAIAYFMGKSGLPNQIGSQQLQRVVETLYQTIPEEVSTRVPPASQEMNIPLLRRMSGAEHVLESIITDVRACGLLVTDPSKPGSFKFAHKSFMEYLVAEVESDAYLPEERLKDLEILLSPVYDTDSRMRSRTLLRIPEAMAFAAELLVNRVRQASQMDPLGEDLRKLIVWQRRRNLSFFWRLFLAEEGLVLMLMLPWSSERSLLTVLDNLENYPILSEYVLYVACCAVAGISIAVSANPIEKKLAHIAHEWIQANLPHLAAPNISTSAIRATAT